MAEDFGVEDRGHFYDPVGALRDVVVNHLMQVVARGRDGGAVARRSRHDQGRAARRCSARSTTADPAHYVRGQYDGYRSIEGVAPDSTTETYAALRLEIDNWRWSGVPFFIRTGKRLPVTQTELRLVFKQPPRLGFGAAATGPSRTSSSSSSTRRPGSGSSSTPTAPTSTGPGPIELDMEFAEEGGEGPTPYEVLLHAAMIGDSTRFTRQDGVEETWRIMQPLLDNAAAGAPVRAGLVGAGRGADEARRRLRPLARALDRGARMSADALRRRSSSAPAPAAARSPGTSRRRARGSSCSSAATGSRASRENWLAQDVFVDNRYVSPDTWYDEKGKPFQPQVHYFVGGATKLYGAALYRLRKEDFGELRHHDGISPAWPISYDELEPYYTQAEQLYEVHGARGEDPTEPPASAPYPFPAVSHEPRIQQLADDLGRTATTRSTRRAAIRLDEANMPLQRLRPLPELRRLPVRRARQVGRRGARRAAGARAPERHAADERAGREARDERGRHAR